MCSAYRTSTRSSKMAKQTLQEQNVAALEAIGFKRVPDGSSRYVLLHMEAPSKRGDGSTAHCYMWVGANGAVRTNNIKRVDCSRSMSEGWKARLREKLAK